MGPPEFSYLRRPQSPSHHSARERGKLLATPGRRDPVQGPARAVWGSTTRRRTGPARSRRAPFGERSHDRCGGCPRPGEADVQPPAGRLGASRAPPRARLRDSPSRARRALPHYESAKEPGSSRPPRLFATRGARGWRTDGVFRTLSICIRFA